MKNHRVFFVLLLSLFLPAGAPFGATPYDIGSPAVTEIYVDPVNGNDGNSGARPDEALKTITAAWNQVPGTLSATGYRINMMPGTYRCEPGPENENCINYFSDRIGTRESPLIMRASEGPDTVTIRGGFNLKNVHYLYLIDLNLVGGGSLPTNYPGNNLLHLEAGDHVLLRRLSVAGPDCPNDSCNNLQEVLKVNQTRHLYVEDCTIGGAWHTSVDYMVVQYGHFLGNRLHTAGQWCMYIKGGTSYLLIQDNELRDCALGFEAGEAANFAMMTSPWLHYDTYDIKFVNNVLHDIPGVGMMAAGGYNTLFAYNTLYRVGISTDNGYSLINAWQGDRNCTATDELPDPVPQCEAYAATGGFGPVILTDSVTALPNRNVYFFNNLFYNPAATRTEYSHFSVRGPITPAPSGFLNIPDPSLADDDLSIRGNMIWNGPADLPLGIEEPDQGCQPANPACNATQLRADNAINMVLPQLVDPAHGDFHPSAGSNVFTSPTYSIPDFTWADAPLSPEVPAGNLSNAVPVDRDGHTRTLPGPPGAYSASAPCSYTLSPSAGTFGPSGGSGTISVTASSPDCNWSAATDDLWTRISSGGSATGNGSVTYAVDPFTGSGRRTARIRVGKTVFVITQSDAQSPTLSVTRDGNGTGTVTSSPAGINCGATCSHDFVQGARVTLTATASPDSGFMGWSGSGCTGTKTCRVTMDGAKSVTATFAACSYAVTSSRNLTFNSSGGSATVKITASGAPSCAVPTVTPASGQTWLTSTRATISRNSGTVTLKATANSGSSADRSATVSISSSDSVRATEKGATCKLGSLSPSSTKTFQNAGGSGTFTVTATPSDCGWTAEVMNQASTQWIAITSGTPGTGTGQVGYSVSPAEGKNRTGKINVAVALKPTVKKTFTVNQKK